MYPKNSVKWSLIYIFFFSHFFPFHTHENTFVSFGAGFVGVKLLKLLSSVFFLLFFYLVDFYIFDWKTWIVLLWLEFACGGDWGVLIFCCCPKYHFNHVRAFVERAKIGSTSVWHKPNHYDIKLNSQKNSLILSKIYMINCCPLMGTILHRYREHALHE